MADPALRRGNGRRFLHTGAVVALTVWLGGCAAVVEPDDACAMANRDPSFQVLMQNSVLNIYNMCLEHMRQEIVTEWGEQ
jgi:hypothetical protein